MNNDSKNNGVVNPPDNYISAVVSASDNVDLSSSTIVIRPKGLGRKLMFTDWENLLDLFCGNLGKVTMKDLQVFAAVCTFVSPKSTKAPFSRKALMNKLPIKITKSQLSLCLKHLVNAGILFIDSEDFYNINPNYTFNGRIEDYRKLGLIK